MKKKKIISIFGSRPEASKMGPLVKKLESCERIQSVVAVTAQHREQLDQMLGVFNIKPDYDLNIMKSRQTIMDITVNALRGLENVFEKEKPDLILAHGDTATTFSALLSAFYMKIPSGHVEAGLRTFKKYEPYPEEMNRQLATRLADIHFAPTRLCKENLLKENIAEEKIYITGNTSVDAVKMFAADNYVFEMEELNKVDYGKKIITMTAHRRENLGEPMENIFRAVKKFMDENKDFYLIYPVHLNPAVRETAAKHLSGHDRILLTEPAGLTDIYNLFKRSFIVLTDSGGLQEEVPELSKPVVVLRNVTERPEGVAAGTLALAGTDEKKVYETINEICFNKDVYEKMAAAKNPFGDGYASDRIVAGILHWFGASKNRPDDFNSSTVGNI